MKISSFPESKVRYFEFSKLLSNKERLKFLREFILDNWSWFRGFFPI
jgi:hypothetical protein